MTVIDLDALPSFVAGDNTRLREILHPRGGAFELGYSLAHAQLDEGGVSLPHRLKSSEVYYVLSGNGRMVIDEEDRMVGVGDTIYIAPGSVQFIENVGAGPLAFLCIVDPAWRAEDEEVLS